MSPAATGRTIEEKRLRNDQNQHMIQRQIPVAIVSLVIAIASGSSSQAQVEGFVTDDGFVAFRFEGEYVGLATFDVKSQGSFLVPIPPGDLTASPEPFHFLLANNPRNVAFGATHSFSDLPSFSGEWVTGIGYMGPPEHCLDRLVSNDLHGSFSWPAIFHTVIQFPCPVPEPSSSALLLIATLAVGQVRQRR